jgi:hypothetical protein
MKSKDAPLSAVNTCGYTPFWGKIRVSENCIAKKGGQKISVYNQRPPQVWPGAIPKNIVSTLKILYL